MKMNSFSVRVPQTIIHLHHFLYAKSCHLYLQDMLDLKERMTAEEYEFFTKFEAANFMVKQATEDADTLIINTAISVSSTFDSVIVVGEDVDLLILLTALSTRSNIYILKPGKGKISQQIYSTKGIIDKTAADHIILPRLQWL